MIHDPLSDDSYETDSHHHGEEWDFDDMFNHEDSNESQSSIADDISDSSDGSFEYVESLPEIKKCFDDFIILGLVGEGAFGKVYQVSDRNSSKIYALKVLKKKHLLKKKAIESTINERDILVKISHPFIVELYYSFQSVDRVGLVMDFVNGGQLFYHMKIEGIFTEKVTQFYVAQLVLALEHLHSHGILHRDLKPENILVDAQGHLVLTDFGLAVEYSDDRAQSFCGTIEYMSPEMVSRKPYGTPSDFWSVGILIYEMLVGHTPYKQRNKKKLQQMISSGKKITMPQYLNPSTHSIIRGLTQKLPQNRLDATQIKTHKFFSSIDWDEMTNKSIPPPFRPTIKRGKLDISNFDECLTSQNTVFSPSSALTHSQDELFYGFSYARSVSASYSFEEYLLEESN